MALCVACSTGSYQEAQRVNLNQKLRPVIGRSFFVICNRNAGCPTEEGTYEAIGPHFRANPYELEKDMIEKHGIRVLPDVPRDFEGIRDYLEKHNIEGIVFWKDGQPRCKIKRSDFGFPWGE